MKRIFAALLLVTFASNAWAKDVCVSDSATTAQFVFRKVKTVKPGGAVPLTGVAIYSGEVYAISGSAVMNSAGTVKIGVWLHTMANINDQNSLHETITAADTTFAGTGVYDNGDHDTQASDYAGDGATTWTSIDCSTVTIP